MKAVRWLQTGVRQTSSQTPNFYVPLRLESPQVQTPSSSSLKVTENKSLYNGLQDSAILENEMVDFVAKQACSKNVQLPV